MTDAEYIQFLKRTLPQFENEVWQTLEKRLKEVEFLVEERDKLKNRVDQLERKIREFERRS